MHLQGDDPVLEAIRNFIGREVAPHVESLEATGDYPDHLVGQLRDLGLFGLAIPERFGGLGLDIGTIARIMEILAGGWASLATYVNSHATVSYLLTKYGTPAQQDHYLPRMATGDIRGALTLTEAGAGSDLQAIQTTARPQGDGFRLSGSKIFVTNGRRAGVLLALARTDPAATKPSRGMSLMLVDKARAGVEVGGDFSKMAHGLVDTCEIHYADVDLPAESLLGGEPGRGLSWLLDGLELGRIMIAASAVGLGEAALAAATRYSLERCSFGKPIAEHQAVQLELATMATKIEAARQLTYEAARRKESDGRADMISGMAKLFASETALEVATGALRIHGGYGYIRGYAVERFFREAPLYIVGEGTNEIQKLVIARRLLEAAREGAA
ncbi:acyl-CoA dehydrogenase family protein [Rhodoligotrophos appendicifer]|uniref:acyl-CoA dehydrogenase family protein n=1 Tax=Rhodoligotrophos appendicifer TaxID=987056 RepID=UPI001961367E|nr:acyl-CoA dehydrogenase family protein [Rhodoligotrophos appendicifer]